MPLSDAACRSAKPAEKPYKLSDAGGLYLLVEKNGSKLRGTLSGSTGSRSWSRGAATRLSGWPTHAPAATPTEPFSRKVSIHRFNGRSTAAPPGSPDRPIADIKASELLDVFRKIERRGRHDTARRTRALSGRVFKFAIATNRAERDPCADLAGALISPKVQHRAALTEPKAVGALMRAIDDLDGQPTTRAALQ